MAIQITPWVFVSFHPRSLAGGEEQSRGSWPNPGESGGFGGEARGDELKGFQPHPWVPLVREEVAGGGGSAASGGCWSSEHGGGVAPVGSGRREAID